MDNAELRKRLKLMSIAIPQHAEKLMAKGADPVARELELLNMSAMTIWTMLGEIALRLPEPSIIVEARRG